MQKNRKAKIIGIIKENIKQNYKEYLISLIFFVGGIFLGVFFINQTAENQIKEVHQYLGDFINQLKETPNTKNNNNRQNIFNNSNLVFWNNSNRNTNSFWNSSI